MKKVLIFFISAILILSIPLTCFAADNTTDIINSVVTTFNTTINRSITSANVQTIIKDNESDYYYITIGKVNNRDKCEINLYNGHYVINNGGYYYSGDWAGSFWLRYNSSNNSLQILGNEYSEVLNDEGKHLKWEPYCAGWIGLGSSISLARADGTTDTISFDNFVGKSSLNSYSAASGTEIIFAELPQNYTVIQLGAYYSQSIFNYCFNSLNPDYDLASISSKLDIIINSLSGIDDIKDMLNSVISCLNNSISYLSDMYRYLNNTQPVLFNRLLEVLKRIDNYFITTDENNLTYILTDIDTILSKFLFKWDDITQMYDFDYSFFDGCANILQKINDYIDDLILQATEKENANDFSTNLSNLQGDSNTIFGASANLANQLNGFVSQIDGSGATSLSVGYSTTFGGANISDKLVISNSWWSPYKPTADGIVSAFMWLVFLFNFFKQLGGILAGNGFTITLHRTHFNPAHYDDELED